MHIITLPSLQTEQTVIVPSGAMMVIGRQLAIALPVINTITVIVVNSFLIVFIPSLWIVGLSLSHAIVYRVHRRIIAP